MNRIHHSAGAFALLVSLSACATEPKPDISSEIARSSLPHFSQNWSATQSRLSGEPVGWIEMIDNDQLQNLIVEAQASNPTLQVARSNVARARALSKQAQAQVLPSVKAGLSAERSAGLESSDTTDLQLAVSASWEPDLWGRLSANRNAAQNSLAALEADYRGAQNLLAAQVAQTYFLIVDTSHQEDILEQSVASIEEIQRIILLREQNGFASAQDVAVIDADLASAKEQLIAVRGAKRNSLRALEVLLGRYPAAMVDVVSSQYRQPLLPPTGLPSSLLERRPDIVAAERRVASAINALDAAKAARLPSLVLNTSAGGASSGLSNILDPSNIAWTASNSLLAPLFDAGRLQAAESAAQADLDGALARYAEIALRALSEVENSLDQRRVVLDRLEEVQAATIASQRAYDVALARFEVGESDLLDVLNVQKKLLSARSLQASLMRQSMDRYIELCLALGGGWSTSVREDARAP